MKVIKQIKIRIGEPLTAVALSSSNISYPNLILSRGSSLRFY